MTLALHAATVLEESNQSLFNTQVEESHLREEQDVIIENRFGTFSVPQHQVISFSAGMLGFETYRDFALLVIPSTKADSPFRLLQSIEEAELSFIVMTTDAKTSVLYKKDVEERKARPWDLLNPNIEKLSEELSIQRLNICNQCEELIKITKQCKKCGCFMAAKTKLQKATCPIGKW